MGNMWVVAKKEFMDYFNNKLMLFILAWYFVTFLMVFYTAIYPYGGYPPLISHYDNPAMGVFVDFEYTLCYLGSIVGIVLGFCSMASEMDGKALNTLLVKPLYRDTIINGKLLGAIGFVICLFIFTSSLYLMAMSIYSISVLNTIDSLLTVYIPSFIGYLPVAFVLSFLCIMFTYSLTLLMCLLFKEKSLSLFLSLLVWVILFRVIPNVSFAGEIGSFTNSLAVQKFVSGFSPFTMLYYINGNPDFGSVMAEGGPQFFRLCLYSFVTIVLSYIAFLRRDVA